MKYKLLALDLDGTLLRRDGTLHERDRWAIARLQSAGVRVTIATGRLYSGSRAAAEAARIEGPIACVDGSHIVDARDHSEISHVGLVGEHALALRRVLERHATASFMFAHDSIVHDEAGEPFSGYVRTWSPNISVVDRVTSHPYWEHERGILAVVGIGSEAHVKAAAEELQSELADAAFVIRFAVHRTGDMHAMVVRANGPTKGTAVAWLAEHYGCTPADVVAVGDWLNDVPMFKVAGRSFAMVRAPEAVKQAATDLLDADGAEEAGVAQAIERAWGTL
ncbi:HAD hydrolase family protein [Polyangium aurulentum]|uniref:HAD hydrolase family protein n=1 Tax=Polyangium aurulentum TaxID=2567896 RepID=UPI0010AEBBA4|nr:HAD hydrolase family protein [Polyangium aurulentum]UQA61575.1 HAD hydrolase family protein [Polyangium aurulentum]